ncbi:hypothetical protein EBGED10_62000 [Bacillus sp. GeD10]|nr:hypothetical protein EBGED10_62000 [Bacillus sp. GeD10]
MIEYWAQGDAGGAPELVSIGLKVNGITLTVTSRSTQQTALTGINYLQVYGSYILNVTSIPTTLNLVNRSNVSLAYGDSATNTQLTAQNIQTCGITIIQLS